MGRKTFPVKTGLLKLPSRDESREGNFFTLAFIFLFSSVFMLKLRKAKINFMQKSKKGFTILELMVVVAIIGLASAFVMASFTSARAKNRDAKRMADMREIQKALALYQIDNNIFPTSVAPTTLTGADAISTQLRDGGHISVVPKDPNHPTTVYTYQSANGSTFTLSFCLETSDIKNYVQGCGNNISP